MTLAFVVVANAQPPNRITTPIDNSQRTTLTGHIHPKATPANDHGPVSPSLKLSWVTLTFTQSAAQQADLKNLLAAQQNPSSPDYHHWLTPTQYADRFGVSFADLAQIEQWLQSQGLSIASVAQGRTWIAVNGTAAQFESAFGTEIHQYVVDGKTHFANASNPSVPTAIASLILSIHGLNDFRLKPHAMKSRSATPKFDSPGGNHYLGPNDIAAIYDITPAYNAGVNGSGQKLVIAGQSQVPTTDLTNYFNYFSMPANLPQMILVPGQPDPGISEGDREESDLDLEISGSVARNASIIFVYSEDVMTSVLYAIDQNLAPVISVSYGSCEQESDPSAQTIQQWAQQGNAEGITWFDASGDDGAADCDDAENPGLAVDTPASVPEVTGVGGTAFVDTSGTYWSSTNGTYGLSALGYIPETSWNTSAEDGEPAASGGGLSIVFAKPSWQVGPGVPANNARNVPDLAFNADPDHDGYIVFSDGQDSPQVYGGTSCGTPLMAGIAALLNQYQQTGGLGNINPNLYSLAQSNPSVFHDITTGNNIVTAQCGSRTCPVADAVGYYAGPGYDNVTGIGSVDAWMLITCWTGTCSSSGSAPTQPASPSASLSLISNLSSVGQQDLASLTATAVAVNGAATPQGVVVFSAGTTNLGSVALTGSAGISTATLTVEGDQLPLGTTTITATYEGSSTSAPVTSSVTLSVRAVGTSSNGTPAIPSNGLVDGASFHAQFSPGMILSIFGGTLAPAGTAEAASAVPLPLTMAGVSATVNGVAAPLYYVSPTQLNVQVSWQIPVGSAATVVVNNNGKTAQQTFYVAAASPGIFINQANVIVPDSSASPGQTTTLYLAGAGAVTPAVATGSAPSSGSPLPAPQNTTVTVGGMPVTTTFIAIPSWSVGVTQIDFQIPSNIPAGTQPVVVNVNGISSPIAYINIAN